jgi:DNA-directed RNA polymerase subunit RPC12/RpoP
MSISVRCLGCKKKLTAKAELAGKRVKCPSCGQALVLLSGHIQSQPKAGSSLPEKVAPALRTQSLTAPPTTPVAALPGTSIMSRLLGTPVGVFSAVVAGAFSGGCVLLIGSAGKEKGSGSFIDR